jgi:hypothetical protein
MGSELLEELLTNKKEGMHGNFNYYGLKKEA